MVLKDEPALGAVCRPGKAISPISGACRPATILSSVDLPQPLGPTSATNSPAATRKETPCRASMEPRRDGYVIERLSTVRSVA
jgi:hypothetical protein